MKQHTDAAARPEAARGKSPDKARGARKGPKDGKIVPSDELIDAPAGRKQLEEGLEESMDASDPPSALQP